MEEYDERKKRKEKDEQAKETKVKKKILIIVKFLVLIRKGHLPGEENVLLLYVY
jgi:hypothetical protein